MLAPLREGRVVYLLSNQELSSGREPDYRRPRLTTRSTLLRLGAVVPGAGRCEMTRPRRTRVDGFLFTVPAAQCAATSAAFARLRVRPRTFGTLHAGGDPM